MDTHESSSRWIERVEDLIHLLEGSTISELELSEAGTEIRIRRQPSIIAVAQVSTARAGLAVAPGTVAPAAQEDSGIAILAPLTGVYYGAPSPSSSPFVSIGDVIHAGQVVALIEAMKVFNEVQAEVSGRVTALVATSGEVVQKGDVLIQLQAV